MGIRISRTCEHCSHLKKGINTMVCWRDHEDRPARKIYRPSATTCGDWERRGQDKENTHHK